MEDTVRVLRIVEYVGRRSAVEKAIERSIQGQRDCVDYVVRVATLGSYPEILTKGEDNICQHCQETK